MKYSIIVALIFNATDIVAGIISALKMKNIMSSKLRDGLFKKIGFILCYFLAWMIDNYSSFIGFKLGVNVLPAIILYVCTTESVSIIENICIINSDLIPDKLAELFHITLDNR